MLVGLFWMYSYLTEHACLPIWSLAARRRPRTVRRRLRTAQQALRTGVLYWWQLLTASEHLLTIAPSVAAHLPGASSSKLEAACLVVVFGCLAFSLMVLLLCLLCAARRRQHTALRRLLTARRAQRTGEAWSWGGGRPVCRLVQLQIALCQHGLVRTCVVALL